VVWFLAVRARNGNDRDATDRLDPSGVRDGGMMSF